MSEASTVQSKKIYEALSKPFPKEAMTKDGSRGFDLTSIKAQYVRERLNEVLGVDGWSTDTTIIDRTDKGVAVKMSMTIHVGLNQVTRSAFGGAAVKPKGQTYGDLFKSAETDALSKVASNFGVGNDVFKGLVNANTLISSAVSSSPKPASKAASKPSFRDQAKTTKFSYTAVVEVEDEDDI